MRSRGDRTAPPTNQPQDAPYTISFSSSPSLLPSGAGDPVSRCSERERAREGGSDPAPCSLAAAAADVGSREGPEASWLRPGVAAPLPFATG